MAVLAACQDDPVVPPSSKLETVRVVVDGELASIRQVPAFEVDVSPAPPSDTSESAFVAEVRTANNRVFVAFKDSTSPRLSSTKRAVRAEPWHPDRLTQRGTRAAVSPASIADGMSELGARGAKVRKYYDALGIALAEMDATAAAKLRAHPLVDFIEPDRARFAPAALDRAGWRRSALLIQTTPWGVAAVNAPAAWGMTTGSGARLLIIDTGHEQNHEDLPAIPSGNCFGIEGGCDDAFPLPHGTHVAGVAIARDNAVGVVGVAPGMQATDVFFWGACNNLLPGNGGGCDTGEIMTALNWAATSLGLRGVINMSFASTTYSGHMATAVAAAWSAGHVLVAAAGNNLSNVPVYPAAYTNVLGVSGINQNLTFAAQGTTACTAGYSNYGSHVDLAAAFDALTTELSSSYYTQCGTSFATPHVSASAVLARAKNPAWNNGLVVSQLMTTALDLGPPGHDNQFGRGLVQAHLAVGMYAPSITASIVSGQPRLTWNAIPLAQSYRIYRRVGPTSESWDLWATVSSTTYTDISTPVSSFFGYNTQPATSISVGYRVTAVHASGFETSFESFATFIPNGSPPE
jgi:hypothetical protein